MPASFLNLRNTLGLLAATGLFAFSAAAPAADEIEAAYAKYHAAALESGLGALMLPKSYSVVGKTISADGNRATLQIVGTAESIFSGAPQTVAGTVTLVKKNGEWTVEEMNWGSGGGAKPVAIPEAAKSPVATTPALGPASGRAHGAEFRVDKASLSLSGRLRLELRQGKEFFADQAFVILYFFKQGEAIDGLSLSVAAGDAKLENPHIRLDYKVEGDSFPKNESFTKGYAMLLELGPRVGNTMHGRLDLRLPDKAESFVSGSFAAEIE